MKKESKDSQKYMSSVKVGQKGQIVIPKEIREMFGIEPGDTLVLLADTDKGIGIQKMEVFRKITDAILNGKSREISPEPGGGERSRFAREAGKIRGEEETK